MLLWIGYLEPTHSDCLSRHFPVEPFLQILEHNSKHSGDPSARLDIFRHVYVFFFLLFSPMIKQKKKMGKCLRVCALRNNPCVAINTSLSAQGHWTTTTSLQCDSVLFPLHLSSLHMLSFFSLSLSFGAWEIFKGAWRCGNRWRRQVAEYGVTF